MAQFAASKHKEENEKLRAENADLRGEVTQLRAFAKLVANYMDMPSGPDRAALTVRIIDELKEAGYFEPLPAKPGR